MRTVSTSSDIHVARKPVDVYAFVTTPANWVGTHPVTAGVKIDAGATGGVGSRWVEVIKTLDGGEYETEWQATTAVPGHTWVIQADRLRYEGVKCQIVYTFTEEGDGAHFRRDMSVLVDGGAEVGNDFLAALGDSGAHDEYLAAVKAALEVSR
ncbi:SRPBCC family protein [Amycolatopsis japonica]